MDRQHAPTQMLRLRKYLVSLFALLAVATGSLAADGAGSGTTYTRANGPAGPEWMAAPLPASAFGFDRRVWKPVRPAPPQRTDPIAPALHALLGGRGPGDPIDVIVSFRDDVQIPFFPKIDARYPREHPENVRLQAAREALVAEIVAARAPRYAQRAAELRRLGIATRETFWLGDGMALAVPAGQVQALAARTDVASIDPIYAAPLPTVSDGRALIRSEPLYQNVVSFGGYSPRVAIIDSGAPTNHRQFTPRDRIDLQKDCYHTNAGDTACASHTAGWNDVDSCNHGTSTAAILTALDTQGATYRGVTPFHIGTYKVVDDSCLVDFLASVRAVQAAVADGYPVILVETQFQANGLDALSAQANQAFNAGAAVIATNGNFGANGAGSVRSPAMAYNVIGVGARHFFFGTTTSDQSLGPAPYNRIKPDVQAPTGTETAAATGFDALQSFGGTSGAAPYAAGAAALLGAYWNPARYSFGYTIPPGMIYAGLIDSGLQPAYNNTEGAGRISLMDPAWRQGHGEVTLVHQQYVDFYMPDLPLGSKVKAAIWWSDPSFSQHSDVDLSIFDYNQITRGFSWGDVSVFEKAETSPVQSVGTWHIRILAYSVPPGVASQRVFFSWHVVP